MNAAAKSLPRNREHRFFIGAVIAAFAIVFAGFARSYYLKSFFGGPALTLLVHLHGLLMTGWFVLFFTQACLIAKHRVDLHRRLGVFGAAYAAVLVLVGLTTVLRFAARGVHDPADGGFAILILGYDLVLLTVFALLVGTAIALRRRSNFHKRLMLLAILGLLSVAIGRIPLDFIKVDVFRITLLLSDLCVIAAAAVDTVRNRRLHPVFAWGTLLVVASTWLAYLGVQTHTWTRFATWLVS
ncbi:MAG: hypothetical protein ABI132_02570 [Rhodanobacteraceae bacterium]